MARAPELQALSRRHDDALALARWAQRSARGADAAAVDAAWSALRRAYAQHLESHFQAEEALLFPHLRAHGREELAQQLQREHDAVRRTVTRTDDLSAKRLRVLGEVLEQHVHREERDTLPFLERVLGAPQLTAIEVMLTATPTTRGE